MTLATVLFLGLTAASITAYNLALRFIPRDFSPFITMLLAYLGAAGLSLAAVWLVPGAFGWGELRRHLHPAVLLLAASVVGIELGYLLAYRSGLKLSVGPMTATVAATLLLALLALLLFRELPSWRQALGLLVCVLGLTLIVFG